MVEWSLNLSVFMVLRMFGLCNCTQARLKSFSILRWLIISVISQCLYLIGLSFLYLCDTCSLLFWMWARKIYIWSALAWSLLLLVHQPLSGLLQYTAAELLWLCCHLSWPPSTELHLHPDVALQPHQRYINCGSRQTFHLDDSRAVKTFE